MEYLKSLFTAEYMPHGYCVLWEPTIVWSHVLADTLTAGAYFSIPAGILYYNKKKNLPFKGLVYLFCAFIVFCGITHVFGIFTFWNGMYGLEAIAKALTAVISVVTAATLIKTLPHALTLPSQKEMLDAEAQIFEEKKQRLELEKKRDADRLFNEVANLSPVGLLSVSSKSVISFSNNAANELFGYEQGELEGRSLNLLIPEMQNGKHQTWVAAFFDGSIASKTMANGRVVHGLSKEGNVLPIEIRLTKEVSNGEKKTYASIIDLRERLSFQKQLVDANSRFSRVVNATGDFLWEWDVKSKKLWVSDSLPKFLGRTEADFSSPEALFEFIHPDVRSNIQSAFFSCLVNHKNFFEQFPVQMADGSWRWVIARGNTVLDLDGQPLIFSGTITDIDERKQLEQELQKTAAFLQAVYDGVKTAIFVLDVDDVGACRFSAFNKAEEELTGLKFEHIEGKTVAELAPANFPVEVAEQIQARYDQAIETKKDHSYQEMIPFNGRETWWNTNIHPVSDVNGKVVRLIGSASSITELIHAQKEIQNKEIFLESLLDKSINGLYLFNLMEQKNTFINSQYTQLLGYTLEELNAEPDLMNFFHPSDRELVVQHIEEVITSNNNDPVELEYRFKHKNGHWVWCWSFDSILERDKEGNPTTMVGTFIDITNIKENERRLEMSNKELERFAYVASHDLQEPLRKVEAFSELVKTRVENYLDEDGLYEFSRIIDATKRMRRLINDLLKLSRVSTASLDLHKIRVSQIVDRCTEMLSEDIEIASAQIEVKNDMFLYVDDTLFTQLIQDLLSNSIKYRNADKKLKISVLCAKTANHVVITVSDNGIGFDQSQAAEIFLPFKRLVGKSEYPGNGIGLAICQQIARSHGGDITAKSTIGEGCSISIHLPLAHYIGTNENE